MIIIDIWEIYKDYDEENTHAHKQTTLLSTYITKLGLRYAHSKYILISLLYYQHNCIKNIKMFLKA